MNFHEKCSWLKRNPVTAARVIDNTFKSVFGKCILSGMHPIGQVLNFDDRGEFQSIGVKHVHVAFHIKDAPIIGKQSDEEVISFIDRYITCSIPDEQEYPDFSALVQRVQSHHHTKTCRKKKGLNCRFHFPCPPTDKTIISHAQSDKNVLKKAKGVCDKIFDTMKGIVFNLSTVTLSDILKAANVSERDYYHALYTLRSKKTILYKRNINECNISPYNTVILNTLKANMNIQYVTDIYGVLAYLTSYMCKPEHTMSELMKGMCKENIGGSIKEKLNAIGKAFLTKREVSTHEAIMRVLSMPLRRSNIDVVHVSTGTKENRTRVLKSKKALDSIMKMDPNSEDIFAIGMLERYANRPESLRNCCFAYFASNYIVKYATNPKIDDEDSLDKQFNNIPGYEEVDESNELITLENGFGEMRKRSRPCIIRWHSVPKSKDIELYHLRLLQLYLPWRNEDELCHSDGTYTSKFNEVCETIRDTINVYEPGEEITAEDLQAMLENNSDTESENSDTDDPDFAGLNPDNLCTEVDGNDIGGASAANFSVRDMFMSNDHYYEMCKNLNKEQRMMFQFICTHAQETLYSERFGTDPPKPFFLFLSGDAGTGKSHLINVVSEYLRRNLKFPGQAGNQPSILLTASTGPAASRISGQTVHSALHLSSRGFGKERRKLNGKTLGDKNEAYNFLKVMITDEVSMIGDRTLRDIYDTLQVVRGNDEHYGNVSVLFVGDLFQLPPVKQLAPYSDPKDKYDQKTLGIHIWKDLFKLHELTEIVRQGNDPEFAAVVRRVRTGDHFHTDTKYLQQLEFTDTSSWPGQIYLYVSNALKDAHNERSLNAEGEYIYEFTAKDSCVDEKTKRANVKDMLKNKSTSETRGLPTVLRLCVNARVILTINLDVEDHLVNGAIGTVERIHVGNASQADKHLQLKGVIYVKFDNIEVGNKRKQRNLPGNLSQCVPIMVETRTLDLNFSNNDTCVMVTRTQYPLMDAYALTIHKSQGGQYDHIIVDFDKRNPLTGKNTGKIYAGSAYTALSRAKTSLGLKVLNFTKDCVIVSKPALAEYERLRKNNKFQWQNPINDLNGCIMSFLNIVSWNKHFDNFISDPIHIEMCSVFCFVETNILSDPNDNSIRTSDVLENWVGVFKLTNHGLCLCYNKERIQLIKIYDTCETVELLACLIQYGTDELIIAIVYRKPGPLGTFMVDLQNEISKLPTGKRIMIFGDFNMDQIEQANVEKINDFSTNFRPPFKQLSKYSTHRDGGILDLVLDNKEYIDCSEPNLVKWVPTPFSDHFVLFYCL